MPDDDRQESDSPVHPVAEASAEIRRARRVPVAALLNTAGTLAAVVAVAALEPKLPHYVGD